MSPTDPNSDAPPTTDEIDSSGHGNSIFAIFIPKFKSLRAGVSPSKIKNDLLAGSVLGLESVPDGLATGVLGGVNPVAGVYGSVYGFLGGAVFSRSSFMAVQTTGAMAIIVADQNLASFDNRPAALATLTLLSGLFMLLATLAGAAKLLRFIPNAVMVGFINAVGINIILGQIGDLTGYSPDQSNRVLKVFSTFLHLGEVRLGVLAVGLASIALILWLRITKLGSLGLIVAVAVASVLARYLGDGISFVSDVATIPRSVPLPVLPSISAAPSLAVGALSIAFVGLVQGAGVSAGLPEPDDTAPDARQDFAAQSAGNFLAAFFRGMPVGGSMSGSALAMSSGARSRMTYVYASVIMVIVMVTASGLVSRVAMPALAGLLLIVGVDSLKPQRAEQVAKGGHIDTAVMTLTFVLSLILPIQYAVVVGVVIAAVLYVQENSSEVSLARMIGQADGRIEEEPAPRVLGSDDVVVLQPYGNLFFGSAPAIDRALPTIRDSSTNSVVILRLRGTAPLGVAVCNVLKRYSSALRVAGSKLVLVSNDDETLDQFKLLGVTAALGKRNIYEGSRWFGDATRAAVDDATQWVHRRAGTHDDSEA